MQNIKVLLEKTIRKNKPENNEIGLINNQLLNSQKELSPLELAIELSENGKTTVLMTLKDNKETLNKNNFESQQVLMLDFDNSKQDIEQYGLTTLETIDTTFIQNNANFIYETFSSTKEIPRFRVVFILDKPISDKEIIENYYLNLLKKYPTADKACKDVTRKFFGSNNGFIEIDFDNTLDTADFKELIINNERPVNTQQLIKPINDNTGLELWEQLKALSTLELINYEFKSNPNYLRKLYEIRDNNVIARYGDELTKTYYSKSNATKMLVETLDIREFLDLPNENPFHDILETDNNPSASVFIADSGISLYFKHNNKKTYNLINLVAELTKLPLNKAIELLVIITNSTIDRNSELAETVDNINILKGILKDMNFNVLYPDFSKFLGTNVNIAIALLDLMADYTYTDNDGNIRQLLFMTRENILKHVRHNLHKSQPVTLDRIVITIDKLTYLNIFLKLDTTKIPVTVLEKYKENEYGLRVNVLEYNDLVTLEEILETTGMLDELNFTNAALNFEGIARISGIERAFQVFPQHQQNKANLGVRLDHYGMSESKTELESKISKYILKRIGINGYATAKEVEIYTKKYILDKNRKTNSAKRANELINQLRHSIINTYDLELVKVNKQTRTKHNIDNKVNSKSLVFVPKA